MRCAIEGWPDTGGIDPGLHAALVRLVGKLTADWPVAVVERPGVFRIEVEAADWPALARCVVLAMRMCATRVMWLWHITDDAGRIAAELDASGLCAWRGMFCELDGEPAAWNPAAITRSPGTDNAIRKKLAAVVGDSMRAMGVRGAKVEAAARQAPALRLFEFIPEKGWMTTDQLAAVGPSMIQVDGRKGLIHHIKGRVEVGNPGPTDLDAVRVQVVLRGPGGALLCTVSEESATLPVGNVRVVTLKGEAELGGLPVLTIDIGCQAIHRASALFSARILEA